MSDLLVVVITLLVIFGPAAAILWIRDNHRKNKLVKAGLLITDKTILSGTPPHQMGGEISDRLRGYAQLPDTDWTEGSVPDDLLDRAIEATKALNAFSVLCKERSEGTASRKKTDGIDLSWRMDCVRSSGMHVSQAGWNPERRLYELDEWISLEKTTYINPGFWLKLENPSVAEDYAQLNQDLLPETALSRFQNQKIERKGMLRVGDSAYYCFETTEDVEGATIRMQAWIEQDLKLIRKARHAVYENDALMGERIYTFTDAPSDLTIKAPVWVEEEPADSTVTPRILDHW